MRILRASERQRIAWKNGGGEAEDIASEPLEASWDAMDWRVSRAWINASGPFSVFPGIDRTFLVIEGDGVELSPAGLPPARLDPSSLPHAFPGDVSTGCRLLGGPVAALNVMSARGRWRHRLVRHPCSGTLELAADADRTLAVLLAGEAHLRGTDHRPLGPLDGVWLDRRDTVALEAPSGASIALVDLWEDRTRR